MLAGALLAATCGEAPKRPSPGAPQAEPTAPQAEPKTASKPEIAASPTPAPDPPRGPLPQIRVLLHEDGVENAYPRLSADGAQILYQSNRTGAWQLWVMPTAGGASRRVLDDRWNDNFPDWSADGEWIAFTSDRDGNEELYRVRTDGKKLERLTDHPARDIHPYFAPDGKSLLWSSTRDGDFDIYRLRLSDREIERVTSTKENDTCARDSPDMASMVFLRNDIHMDDVMVMDAKSGTVTNLTKTPHVMDGWPMFSADGAWIYYSTTAGGAHSIHRVHPDGEGDEPLTVARLGEEHGRAFIARDGHTLVFNERRRGGIDISALDVPAGPI